jgi:hypothetical protein
VRIPPARRFRGLLKFVAAAIAVVIAAAIVGIGIGLGLSKVSGSDTGGASLPTPSASPTTATTASTPATAATTATATSTSTATAPEADTTPQSATPADIPQGANVPRVRIVSAVLFPAATASGRARQRARISVRVRVTNRDSKTLTPPNSLLLTGSDRISVDTRADEAAGALLKPIAPSKTANGELRFEIAGTVTQRLTDKPRARLAIVNRIVALKITISPTPAPPG